MSQSSRGKREILDAVRRAARDIGRPPSRSQFIKASGISEYQILRHFASWREAVQAAGLQPATTNIKLDDADLLQEWGELARKLGRIPTRTEYRRQGRHSANVFDTHFGRWSAVPRKFRDFARERLDWTDVLALLAAEDYKRTQADASLEVVTNSSGGGSPDISAHQQYSKLADRATYGDPIDFRGLRHKPVNEQGVIFLFGMVAKELGFMVEGIQTGFPDCEGKRQIGPGKWQRVRIEFEFESRNFRDHGHTSSGCDVIVCWRHNWPECPIEVLELSDLIKSLA